MKRIQFFLSAFFTILFSCGYAQQSLISGYIITNNQDTLHGFLEFESDVKLRERVRFYENRNTEEEPKVLTPSEVKEFSFINKRTFISLLDEKDSAMVFAKKIMTGKINMFVSDKKGPKKFNIFLFRSDTALSVELSPPSKEIVEYDNEAYIYHGKKFIGKIAYLTNNKKPDNSLLSLNYSQNKIKKYILSYNEKFSDQYPVSTYKDSSNISLSILVGTPVFVKTPVFNYRVSLYADITNVESMPGLSYRAGVSYRYYNHDEIGHIVSILPVGVQYQFNTKKIIPYGYVAAGQCFCFYLDENKLENFNTFLTVNTAIGAKLKLKRNKYILFEVSPASRIGVFVNIGVSL